MGHKRVRPVPPLDGSTLVHYRDHLFVDSVTGMVLSRVGRLATLPSGYVVERVAIDGRETLVSRVVYEAVIGPLDTHLVINHLDGDATNNRPDNLEQVSQAINCQHTYDIGRREGNGLTGKRRPRRLSERDIVRLKEAPRGTIHALADELGISARYAYDVRGGRRLRN